MLAPFECNIENGLIKLESTDSSECSVLRISDIIRLHHGESEIRLHLVSTEYIIQIYKLTSTPAQLAKSFKFAYSGDMKALAKRLTQEMSAHKGGWFNGEV